MTPTIIIYHSADFDGIFCREIARKFIPEAELIGWDYGQPEPIVPASCKLYMLDISVDGLMGHLNLVWIDHHKSAMEKFGKLPGWQIDGVAACRLAWQWFAAEGPLKHLTLGKSDFTDRLVKEPLAVRLAGEYDIWDKRDPNADLFQHGLRSRELKPFDWGMLLSDKVNPTLEGTGMEITDSELACNALLNGGRAIQYVQTEQNASIIKAYGFTVEFEGLYFLACNHARFNSHLFTAGLEERHKGCLGFNWDWPKQEWRVSLYHAPGHEDIDLSLIAVKHGGGGHKGACGFRIKNLPFLP